MKRFATLALYCMCALTSPTHAQTSHYAGDPLLLGAGARALGMGSAYVALSFDATAVYWNPAGLAPEVYSRTDFDIPPKREIHVQHAEQFGGSINHDILALRLPIRKGGIGLGIVRAGVDGIALTGLEDPDRPIGPDNRPVIIDKIGTADYVFRIAYGRHITDKLRLGAGIKMIRRDLSVGIGSGFGLDIGLLYLPTSTFRIGATIRDLTKTRIAFPDGITDRISPSLLIGLALLRRVPGGDMTVGFSTHLNDEKSTREKTSSIQLGTEYRLQHRLAFRLGYKDGHFTAGTGLQLRRFGVDLAFMEHDQLDNTYRISATLFF
ncbi:MAG: PorV/PorQ family protein [Gemmatimonadetes bacterium]|nr:PorV/PorQ family protein [Gemmatimonadota bacterium]